MNGSSTSPLVAAIMNMTRPEIHAVSTSDVASLSTSDLEALSAAQLRSFSLAQIAAVNPAALAALDANTFREFTRREVGALTTTEVAALSSAEVETLSRGKLAFMSAAQIGALDPNAFSALGAFRIGSLNATQTAGLTTSEFAALTPWEIEHLGAQTLSGVSVADFQSLSATQFSFLDASALAALGGAKLAQIGAALFTPDQIAGFTSTTIASLTPSFFGSLSGAALAAISLDGLAGVSVADLQSLSATQLGGFSQAQMSAMSPAQLAVIGKFNPLILQAASLEVDGVLTVGGAETLLQGVASSGLNATSFAQLQELGGKLQSPDSDGISGSDDAILATAAAQQLFGDVAFGNAENASWNGGAVASVALGDLTATSSQSQFDALIDKWFGGGDLPSLQVDVGGTISPATYAPNASPLYDTAGTVAMTDVLQGDLADSALLAGVAETALQDPGYIKQLITDNGDGTYQVELPSMFGSTYVTVNNELPSGADGAATATATSATGLWVALLEKAAAQNSVDSATADGSGSSAGNSYASLTINNDSQVELYSGQFYWPATLTSGQSQAALDQVMTGAQASFAKGDNVILEDGDQFYAVTGVDAAHGLVSLYDPKGGALSTISLATMVKDGDTLYFGITGRAAA